MVMNEWFINASVRTHTTSGDQDQSIQLALRHSPFGEFGHSVQFVTLEDTARSARAGIDVCDHQLGALTSFAMRCIAKVLPVTHRPLLLLTTASTQGRILTRACDLCRATASLSSAAAATALALIGVNTTSSS